MIAVQL